jgi:hypothetical protein
VCPKEDGGEEEEAFLYYWEGNASSVSFQLPLTTLYTILTHTYD